MTGILRTGAANDKTREKGNLTQEERKKERIFQPQKHVMYAQGKGVINKARISILWFAFPVRRVDGGVWRVRGLSANSVVGLSSVSSNTTPEAPAVPGSLWGIAVPQIEAGGPLLFQYT